jgi:SAM-dependent methyltransferase
VTGMGARRDGGSSWEAWAQVDPLWAIVTEDGKEAGRWDLQEFFASGRATIDALWETATSLGLPCGRGAALDFGCGVGRLTRALGGHVDHVLGLDIAPSMVGLAREYNAAFPNLWFEVHQGKTLSPYGDGCFDVVCCLLVLQHLPSVEDMVRTLAELLRVLAAGGILLLQLPDRVPPVPAPTGLRSRLRPRTRAAHLLRRLGAPPRLLYDHLGWRPAMTMRALPEEEVRSLITAHGGRVVWSDSREDPSGVRNVSYLVTH